MKLKMFTILALAGTLRYQAAAPTNREAEPATEPTRAEPKTETPTAPVNVNWFATAGGLEPAAMDHGAWHR